MSPEWKSTEVARALEQAFIALPAEERPLVVPYGINDAALWNLDSPSVAEQLVSTARNGLVLIWDSSTPSYSYSGNVSTAEYLNPLTWSLCASKRFPALKIVVLDCDVDAHSQGKFYQVVRAVEPKRLPFCLVTNPSHIVAEWTSFLRVRTGLNASPADSDLLMHSLRAILMGRGRESLHHALANIVGPMILLGMKYEDESRNALRLLFCDVGLLRYASDSSPAAGPDSKAPPPLFGRRPVRLLLVDDQGAQGWDKWVQKMVAQESMCSLDVREHPAVLLEAVRRWMLTPGRAADNRFQLDIPPLGGGAALSDGAELETILMLDLRLFSLAGPDEEAKFVKELIPLCVIFKDDTADALSSGEGRFAWPGFSSSELLAASKWCENPVRETDVHHGVLSLLPRLLALVDLSMPIVIFSSTGQRRIIELLKPYGNIVTDFEKPRFTGMETSDLIADAEGRFRDALSKAHEMLLARRQCRLVLAPEGLASLGRAEESAPIAGQRAKYVELLLDEVDWQGKGSSFSVGGCYAVFDAPDVASARAKADRFDDWLVDRGVRYFDNRGLGRSTRDGKLRKKGADLKPFIGNYHECQDAPSFLGAVRLRIERGPQDHLDGLLFDPVNADNRYHLALNALLELFLCESVPAFAGSIPSEDVAISVFPATRIAYLGNPNGQSLAMLKFGFKPLSAFSPNMFFSFNRSDVYPKVATILDSRAISRATHRLLAVQLPYANSKIPLPEFFRCHRCDAVAWFGSKKDRDGNIPIGEAKCSCNPSDWQPDYRALHYLADEVLTEFPDGKPRRYDDIFSRDLVPGEFDELRDEILEGELSSGRCLDLGDYVGAISQFRAVGRIPAGVKPRAGFWLRKRIAATLPKLCGAEFLRIAGEISRQSPWSFGDVFEVPKVAPAPQPSSGQSSASELVEIQKKWRLKFFDTIKKYAFSPGRWDQKGSGFSVRVIRSNVVVFADLTAVNANELEGFLPPADTKLFRRGNPVGVPFRRRDAPFSGMGI